MDERTRAHIDLLNEFDSICVENGLKYTLTDAVLDSLIDNENLPEQIYYVTVAMTGGDIERLTKLVNGNIRGRFVETFVTNPNGRTIHVRYCNSNTTRINLGNYKYHVNHGIFIRIVEIITVPDNEPKTYLSLASLWKKSYMEQREYSSKEKALIGVINIGKKVLGREKAAEKLYNYRSRFYYVDKWDNLKKYNRIRIGNITLRGSVLGSLERIKTSEGEYSISRSLKGYNTVKVLTTTDIQSQEIWDLDTPFDEVMTGEFMKHIEAASMAREEYMIINDRVKAAGVVKAKGWNTYLMSRDIVKLENLFDSDKKSKLRGLLEDNNLNAFDEEILAYEVVKNNWTRKGVPFRTINDLEMLLEIRSNYSG